MHYPKLFRPTLIAALALCLAFTAMMPATAQQQPPQPPTKPPEQKKSDPPKGDQKKAPQRQGAQVEPVAQDPGGVTLSVDTSMVLLDVKVIDQANRPIYNLTKDDFTVYEDKVKQKIVSFGSEDAPLSIGIVFDTSASMGSSASPARA